EVRIGHQLPHKRRQCGRRHQGKQQENGGNIIESRLLLQQECNGKAEHELEAHGQERIKQRNINRVPEFRIVEKINVVAEPDEALHLGQVQPVAKHRV